MIGLLLAGALYSLVGYSAPYWFGLVVVAVLLVLAWPLLREPAREVASNTA